ncbi:allantoin permease, partial [Klebsiella variicola]|nr:allantoin permease [Klebsiella variicola]
GAVLGIDLLTRGPAVHNTEPVQQFGSVVDNLVPGWLALTLAVELVVISQIKINVTNAYSVSLAWTSAWTRTTKRYQG